MMNAANQVTRRAFINRSAVGIGSVALASQLLADDRLDALPNQTLGGNIQPHFPAKAKRVIFMCMAGGPSQLETFDYKPKLAEMDGQEMPTEFTKGQPIAQLQGKPLKCFAPQFKFNQHGQSGQEISDQFPHIAKLADDIAIVRSMTTKQINHDPAHTFMNCGTQISGRPCMGSWVQYGLGSESKNLPGFVVLASEGGGQSQPIASGSGTVGFFPVDTRA